MGKLGDLIWSARVRRGMTQIDLAIESRVSDRTIRDIEIGKRIKSGRRKAETLKLLAAALKLPHDLLFSMDMLDCGISPGNEIWDGETPSIASLMENLRRAQGTLADAVTVRTICAQQRAALQGFLCKLDGYTATAPPATRGDESGTNDPRRSRELVGRVLLHMRRLRESLASASATPVESIVEATLTRLRDERRHLAHADGIDNALSAEYVLGLAYFETLVHLASTLDGEFVRLDRRRLSAALDLASYSAGLDGVFRWHEHAVAQLNAAYDDTSDERLWGALLAAKVSSVERCPELDAAIEDAVSLRTESRRLPETATAAQLLHWDGWGGDGRVFNDLESAPRVAGSGVLGVLYRHRNHAFDWHQLRGGDLCPLTHFVARQGHFREAAGHLARYAARCSAALLDQAALRSSPDRLDLWGDAVGPTAIAERRILERFRRTAAQRGVYRVRVRLILTEISAPALASLADVDIGDDATTTVLWRDLNREFPGEPGAEVTQPLSRLLTAGTYDCYSCSIALHQIADRRTGTERLQKILAFATRLVRPGGVVSIPDVGVGVAMQVYLLPINLVDREGGWGCATFLDERGFLDLACTMNGEPLDRRGGGASSAMYKVPVPVVALRCGAPEVLDASSSALYEYVPFLVVAVELRRLLRFDQAWREARSRETRANLALELMSETWRGVEAIVDEVRDQSRKCS